MDALAIMLFALAGVSNGSFTAPMKGAREWKWEHIWFVYTLASYGVLPIVLLFCIGRYDVFRLLAVEWRTVVIIAFYGAMFGSGTVLFGLSLKRLGIAVTNGLVCSVCALAASLGPLLLGYARIREEQYLLLGLGLVTLVVGIFACVFSSHLRDRSPTGDRRDWLTGILIAIAAGLLSAMMNIGFAAGTHLTAVAVAQGYGGLVGTLVIWVPVLAGGLVVGLAYTGFQIHSNASWSQFVAPGSGSSWICGLAMGALWFGAVVVYGVGAVRVGQAGVVYGPAMTAGGSLIMANIWSVIRKEWPTTGPRWAMYGATTVLVLSFCLMAMANNNGP